MEKKKLNIDDLLNALKNPEAYKEERSKPHLENSKETWRRIGLKDDFSELGFGDKIEKEKFIKEWLKENEYDNLR